MMMRSQRKSGHHPNDHTNQKHYYEDVTHNQLPFLVEPCDYHGVRNTFDISSVSRLCIFNQKAGQERTSY